MWVLIYVHVLVFRKHCVHSFNVFDFLKDAVSKVPDLGGSDAVGDDRSSKRRLDLKFFRHCYLKFVVVSSVIWLECGICFSRKAADEGNESDEDSKQRKTVRNPCC